MTRLEQDHSSLLGGHGHGSDVLGREIVLQLVLGGAVMLLVVALLALILVRRARRAPAPPEPAQPEDEAGHRWLWLGGIALPLVAISVVALAEARSLRDLDATGSGPPLEIRVVGHRWWWEVRYPGSPPVVTANELVVPVGRPVHLVLRTRDVQHAIWIPGLDRKVDMVPGHVNTLDLTATDTGNYLGECMELCGLQHANMRFEARVVPAGTFGRWLGHERAAAATPTGRLVQEGRRVLLRESCTACHTIAGTPAQGDVGPDLTHLAERPVIAAGALPNTATALVRWISDPQSVKRGANMPATSLPPGQLHALVAYLQSLR